MSYTTEQVEQLNRDKRLASTALVKQFRDLAQGLAPTLATEKAQEYLNHGVCRRLKVVARCLDKIFEIFPVDRTQLLNWDEVADIQIHLHAFVININGLLDNLAWVFVCEKALEGVIEGGRQGIGLFKKETQKHLPDELKIHLATERMREWHNRYAKDYRDVLAHRIPLYVPPSMVTTDDVEQYKATERAQMAALLSGDFAGAHQKNLELEALQKVCFTFTHSYSESEMVLYLHPQMIADANTVLELNEKFRKHLGKPSS